MRIFKDIIKSSFGIGAAVVLLSLTSCVDEKFSDCRTFGTLNPGDEAYITIRIKSPEGSLKTRAGEWDGFSDPETNPEEESEHLIGENNYVIFFDKDLKFSRSLKLNKSSNSSLSHDELDDVENEEAVYRVKYTVPEAYETPANPNEILGYCMVVLNGLPVMNKIENANGDINTIRKILWENSTDPTTIGREEHLFTMTNSTFFNNGTLIGAQPFTAAVIQDPEEAEFTWDRDKTITVFVERMVAKFSCDFEDYDEKTDDHVIYTPEKNKINVYSHIDENGIPVYDENKYTYKVKLTGLGMNALAKESYLFKNVNQSGNYFNGWSEPENYRTYWAEDVHYSDTDYPWQYRNAVDRDLMYYSKDITKDHLLNYSYNDFVGQKNFGKKLYTPENTYDFNTLTDAQFDQRRDVLAGTHLLVTAELMTDIFGDYQVKDLYRDRYGNFYRNKRECFLALVMAFQYTLNSNIDLKYKFYNWTPDVFQNDAKMVDVDGDYRLYYDGNELTEKYIKETFDEDMTGFVLPATMKDADGKIIFWNDKLEIKNTSTGEKVKLAHYTDRILETGKFEKLIDGVAGIDDLKNVLVEWFGPVDHFSDGKMYYYVPVTHKDAGNICGVVRDHWYKFGIIGVKEIGTPVDQPDDPIVPNKPPTKDRINFTMKVIDWHEYETDVDFDWTPRDPSNDNYIH